MWNIWLLLFENCTHLWHACLGVYLCKGRGLVKMKINIVRAFLIVFVIFTVMPITSHAQFADGIYELKYQVNKPESISASMANDYFIKPAKLIVKDGKSTVQITIKNSAWVTEFNPPGGATVVSKNEGADSRVVQFAVSNLSAALTVAMKIDIDDINYHHGYSVDFVFDSSTIPTVTTAQASTSNKKDNKVTSGSSNASNALSASKVDKNSVSTSVTNTNGVANQVENPQTSDSLPYVFIIAMIASAFLFIRTKQTN